MPYDMDVDPPWAECPKCNRRDHGRDEIEEYFGFRGQDWPQSWCKICRDEKTYRGWGGRTGRPGGPKRKDN